MTLEETVKKLTELEIKFEGLKDTMAVFQDGINNSIYWFIAALGIFVALLGVVGVALYFIVQTAINKGLEKGIKEGVRVKVDEYEGQILKLKSEIKNINPESEKGIWTPELNGYPNYKLQNGMYYQNGKIVILWFDLEVDSKDSSLDSSINFTIRGLPWLPKEDAYGDVNFINNYQSENPLGVNLKAIIKRNDNVIRLVNPKNYVSAKYSTPSTNFMAMRQS